ncbi:hypothetical protein TNCV_1227851, partial [Trichonephila clavipes]
MPIMRPSLKFPRVPFRLGNLGKIKILSMFSYLRSSAPPSGKETGVKIPRGD